MRWRERWARARDGSREAVPDELWPRALSAGKAQASAVTLAVFVAGITLDDLHLFRLPMLYLGVGLAVAVFAFMPPWFASRLLRRVARDASEHAQASMENALMRRRALLGLSIGLFVVWLILFSSGRTPRW